MALAIFGMAIAIIGELTGIMFIKYAGMYMSPIGLVLFPPMFLYIGYRYMKSPDDEPKIAFLLLDFFPLIMLLMFGMFLIVSSLLFEELLEVLSNRDGP